MLLMLWSALLVSAAAAPETAPSAPAPSPPAVSKSAQNGAEVAVDPLALKAADRLLDVIGYDRMMERMSESMLAQLGPSMKKSIETKLGEPVDDELIQQLTDVQARFFRTTLIDDPSLRRATAMIYARHFTAPELDRLAVLYRDPVMFKWTEVTPAMMADLVPLLFSFLEVHRDRLREEATRVAQAYFNERGGQTSN